MTHNDLVLRAAAWLRSVGCSIVLTEFVSLQTEQPDAIGWRDSGRTSFLVECKTSRADFHADRRKGFRQEPERGMGSFRYFLCPPGVLRPDDLPPRWGLLWCHPKVIEVVAGKHPRRHDHDGDVAFRHHPMNIAGELTMLHSALIRLQLDLGAAEFRRRVHLPYMDRQRELSHRAAAVE